MATSGRSEGREQAFRDLFDRVWPEVDKQVSHICSFPWTTPQPARALAEQSFALRIQRSSLDSTDPAGRAQLDALFTKHAREHAAAALDATLANLQRLDLSLLKKLRVRKPKATGEPFRRPGALARNLELAWFVVERVIPFDELLHGRVKLGPRNRHGIPWDALANEWNALSPDPGRHFSSGRTLSRGYYRAVANSHLVGDLLDELKPEVYEASKDSFRYFRDFLRWHRGLTPAQRARRLPPPMAILPHSFQTGLPRVRESTGRARGQPRARQILTDQGRRDRLSRLTRQQLRLVDPRVVLLHLSVIQEGFAAIKGRDAIPQPWPHPWPDAGKPLRFWFLDAPRGRPCELLEEGLLMAGERRANRAADEQAGPEVPPSTSPHAKPGQKAAPPSVGRKVRAKPRSTSRTSLPSR